MRREDWLSNQAIGAAIEAHKQLGPGLLINFNVLLLKSGIRRLVLNY